MTSPLGDGWGAPEGWPAAPPVARATLHRVRLPLRAAHVAAHGTEATREVVLVQVDDGEGAVGWGECPTLARPGYSPEWTDQAWTVLRDRLAPAVLAGGEPPAAGPMATGAVRDALLDLSLRRAGARLAEPAAGPRRATVPFGVAVGLAEDVGEVVAAAGVAAEAGAGLVVLKVRPGWAVRPFAAVRASLPDGVAVAVDANGSFSLADLDELRALDELSPAFVEQPLAADDLEGSAVAAAALAAPVALDEGVVGPRDLAAAISVEAGAVLTVKPARLGGLAAATVAADRARAAGWGLHVGGMLESGVGRAAARLLAARPDVDGPSMVGPTDLLFSDDVVGPARRDAAGVEVWSGRGLGPAPDPERLERLTVDHWSAGQLDR